MVNFAKYRESGKLVTAAFQMLPFCYSTVLLEVYAVLTSLRYR